MAFSLTFRSLIYSEFTFVYDVRECSNFTLLHEAIQFSQHHCTCLPPLSQTNRPEAQVLFLGFTFCPTDPCVCLVYCSFVV